MAFKWYYRESSSSTWISGGTIQPNISTNTYNNGATSISLGKIFNYQKMYEIYLEITDKLTTLKPIYVINKGIPIFNWGEDYFNINGELLINEETLDKKILYENSVGTTGTVTLSQSVVSFEYIDIVYGKSGKTKIARVYNANNKTVNLSMFYMATDTLMQIAFAEVNINATSITKSKYGSVNFNTNGTISGGTISDNGICIYQVLGGNKTI